MPRHPLSTLVVKTVAPGLLCIQGELDFSSVEVLERALIETERDGARNGTLVLDLSDLSFIDSTGVRLLLVLRRRTAQDRRRLILRSPSAIVMRVLGALGLDGVFSVEDGEIG